jgi:hypothetical protein
VLIKRARWVASIKHHESAAFKVGDLAALGLQPRVQRVVDTAHDPVEFMRAKDGS